VKKDRGKVSIGPFWAGRKMIALTLIGADVPMPIAPRPLRRATHCRPIDRAAPRAQATRTAIFSLARSRCWTRARGPGARRGCRRARSQGPLRTAAAHAATALAAKAPSAPGGSALHRVRPQPAGPGRPCRRAQRSSLPHSPQAGASKPSATRAPRRAKRGPVIELAACDQAAAASHEQLTVCCSSPAAPPAHARGRPSGACDAAARGLP